MNLLREPLLHFLLLGAAVFALYGWLNRDLPGEDEIVLTSGQQQHLVTVFRRTWQRPPTAAEFEGLVRDWLREEVAYREGVELGFHENDTVIRRRLRQKLELLAEDIAELAPPSEAELQRWLEEHADDYRVAPRLTLQQIYFSPDRRGDQAAADARAALALLARAGPVDETGGRYDEYGDPLPLPARLEDVSEDELERLVGGDFAESLRGLEIGRWQGPVESGYGIHLVFIERREAGRVPDLAEVRQAVERDWRYARERAAIDALYEGLAEKYTVVVEPFAPAAADAASP